MGVIYCCQSITVANLLTYSCSRVSSKVVVVISFHNLWFWGCRCCFWRHRHRATHWVLFSRCLLNGKRRLCWPLLKHYACIWAILSRERKEAEVIGEEETCGVFSSIALVARCPHRVAEFSKWPLDPKRECSKIRFHKRLELDYSTNILGELFHPY